MTPDGASRLMSTEKTFLQTICETPDDDAPRLVFADWLEDNGQSERAELIRTQCRRAKMDEWDDGYEDLAQREQELLEKYGKKWGKAAWTPRGMTLPITDRTSRSGGGLLVTPTIPPVP
jgi:uncharacterized protein (TIGR02996 family)